VGISGNYGLVGLVLISCPVPVCALRLSNQFRCMVGSLIGRDPIILVLAAFRRGNRLEVECQLDHFRLADQSENDLITAASLQSQKLKELAQLARKQGIPGWHSMRKAQLIGALIEHSKKEKKAKPKSASKASPASRKKSTNPRRKSASQSGQSERSKSLIAKKIRAQRQQEEQLKDLALLMESGRSHRAPKNDRIILVVRDSFWVQAYWEITRASVSRARAAFAGNWHSAQPVLRLLKISNDGNTNAVEEIVEEIPIHGGVSNWFINVKVQSRNYRVVIGYLCKESGRFHLICKSNEVNLPNASEAADCTWNDITNEAQRFYSLSGGNDPNLASADLRAVFEEKSRQPMHIPAFQRLGSAIYPAARQFEFEVDAHMIVHGSTDPQANVSVGGEPVHVETDGTFVLKMDLPDRRQVLPVIASSRDGTEQRTTVLAIERNTKVMEPLTREIDEIE